MNTQVPQILLVEDNPADVRLVREALREWNSSHILHVAEDGQAAIDFVFGCKDPGRKSIPDLILLDINLPKRNGFDVLKTLKTQTDLRRIPVVMLTSSDSDKDVERAYDNHANVYVQKPTDLDDYLSLIAGLQRFWFKVAILPTVGN